MKTEHEIWHAKPELQIAAWLRSMNEQDLADAVLEGEYQRYWAELQSEDGAESAQDVVDLMGAYRAE